MTFLIRNSILFITRVIGDKRGENKYTCHLYVIFEALDPEGLLAMGLNVDEDVGIDIDVGTT